MEDLYSNIPMLGGVIRRPQENEGRPTPLNDAIVKSNAEYIREHPELLEKFSEISKNLIKMGFPTKLINNLFLVKRFQTLDEAIDLLSKTNNQWNHAFYEGDYELCFICEASKEDHFNRNAAIEEKMMMLKKSSVPIEFKRLGSKDKVQVSVNLSSSNNETVKINVKSCGICFLEIEEDMKYSLSCQHEFCRDCIVSYLEEEIKVSRVDDLHCPQSNCVIKFNEEQIKSLVTPDIFRKYNKFKLRNKIKDDKDLVICPIADCEGFAKISENEKNQGINRDKISENILENENDPLLVEDLKIKKNDKELYKIKYTCNNNHHFCGKCMKAWHKNTSCDDDKDILEFATDSGKIVRKCPNCKVWTEKDEGCNHMHCKMCEYDWCWLCEGHCPQDHFTIRGTPCYGKQFNEQGDPDIEYIEILHNQDSFLNSLAFFFVLSFLIISALVRQILFHNGRRNNNSKCLAFTSVTIFLIIGLFFLCLSNGIIALYLIVNLGKFQRVRSKLSKVTAFLSFFLFWFIFYFPGYVLVGIWFVIAFIFATLKVSLS